MIQLLCFVTALASILFMLMCLFQVCNALHDWLDEKEGAGLRMIFAILGMCVFILIAGAALNYGNMPVPKQVYNQEGR